MNITIQYVCVVLAVLLISKVQLAAACSSDDPCVTGVDPNKGSLNGGTRITITGSGFSPNQFSYGSGNEHLGNTVTLVSGVRSYPCDIHRDGCTVSQVTCYTREMVTDTYYVRVVVDGRAIPINKHCNGPLSESCSFQSLQEKTPTIEKLETVSGMPEDLICLYGRLFTDKFGSNVADGIKDPKAKITRVWLNGGLCQLLKQDSDEFYKLSLESEESNYGNLCCKPSTTFIGGWNMTILVDGTYGRTAVTNNLLHIDNKDRLTMYQAYAVVSGSLPSEGSIVGGTKLLITGNYFDNTTEKIQVSVGGQPCRDVSFDSTRQISCYTPPQSTNVSYQGNRGMQVDMWTSSGIEQKNDTEISALTDAPNWSGWIGSGVWKREASITGAFAVRVQSYYRVPKSSDYKFYLLSADYGALYISTTGKPGDKILAGKNTESYLKADGLAAQSQRLALKKGDLVYLEVIHKGAGPEASVQLAVHRYTSQYTASQSYHAVNEQFRVKTTSKVTNEIQTISFENLTAYDSSTPEVQEFVVKCSNLSRQFHFEILGVRSAPMSFLDASDGLVVSALNNLPFFGSNDKFKVTVDTIGIFEKKFSITFPDYKGDYPDIQIKWVDSTSSDSTTSDVLVKDFKETKGVAVGKQKLHLTFGNAISPELDASNLDANKLKNAITSMLKVRCPKYIENPQSPRPGYFQDFESSQHEIEPFCGGRSGLNQLYMLLRYDWKNMQWPNIGIPGIHSKFCFAFRGVISNSLYAYYRDTSGRPRGQTIYDAFASYTDPTRSDYYPEVVKDSDPRAYETWRYRCVCLKTILKDNIGQFLAIKVFRLDEAKPLYVDNILLTSALPSYTSKVPEELSYGKNSYRVNSLILHERLRPDRWINDGVSVSKSSTGNKYTVTMKILDCHDNLPHIGVLNANNAVDDASSSLKPMISYVGQTKEYSWTHLPNMKVQVEKVQLASPPITGTYDLKLGGYSLPGVPANVDEPTLSGRIKTLDFDKFGDIKVTRSGSCSAYTWDVEYTTVPGDHPNVQQQSHSLQGLEVATSVETRQDGGVFQNPIPGDTLSTGQHDKPQVVVDINGVPSKCEGDCNFSWSNTKTPTITAVAPTSGSKPENTILTITGQGFSSTTGNNVVTIGGVLCDVVGSSGYQITCSIGEGPAGEHKVIVRVIGSGEAQHQTGPFNFEYNFAVTGISRGDTGYLTGGAIATISGSGFSSHSEVQIDGKVCEAVERKYASIACIVPSGVSLGAKQVIVTDNGKTASGTATFTYETTVASIMALSGADASKGSMEGGKVITILGNGFGTVKNEVLIGKTPAKVNSWSNTLIMLELPVLKQGQYDLAVKVGNKGFASGGSKITYQFEVYSVFPTHGSFMGGTKITISGKGLESKTTKTEITFSGTPCYVEKATDTEVICELGYASTTYFITSDGIHPRFGKGYAWTPDDVVMEEGDRAHFKWSTPSGITGNIGFRVAQVKNVTTTVDLGSNGAFRSGTVKTRKGEWTYQVVARNEPYIYYSGEINTGGSMTAYGRLTVKEKQDLTKYLSFRINNMEAEYKLNSLPPMGSTCTSNSLSGLSCGTLKTDPYFEGSRFKIGLMKCLTPTVSGISPGVVSSSKQITITGTGFSTSCDNKVYIERDYFDGDIECKVNKMMSSDTKLVCTIDPLCTVPVGVPLSIDVFVANKGFAMHTQLNKTARGIIVIPEVSLIFPKTGAFGGGSLVTITGSNFRLNNPPCKTFSFFGKRKRRSLLMDTKTLSGGNGAASFQSGACSSLNIIDSDKMVCKTTKLPGYLPNTPRMLMPQLVTPDGNTLSTPCAMNTLSDCTFQQSKTYGPTVTEVKTEVPSFFGSTVEADVTGSGITKSAQILKIIGERFGSIATELNVTIGDALCNIVAVTDTLIKCTVGDVVNGNQPLTVYRQATESGTINGNAHFTNPKYEKLLVVGSISSITPSTIGTGGCVDIDVQGFGFHPVNTTVTVAGQTCTTSGGSATFVRCVVPSLADGSHPVVVSVLADDLTASSITVSTAVTPTVTAVSPVRGSPGTEVTVTGTNYGTNTASVEVTIDNVACVVKSVSETSVVCTAGQHSGGQFDVRVKVANKGCSTGAVKFQYDLAITSIFPSDGSTGGGQTITVTGKGFDSRNTSVTICGSPCEVNSASVTPTQLQCVTPRQPKGLSGCSVVATLGNGESVKKILGYTYNQNPTVTNVTPSRGGTGGGTRITVQGTGFGTNVNDVTVSIAGSKCDMDTATFTATSFQCVTNSHRPSVRAKVDVKIRVSGIAEQIQADFEYVDLWSSKFTWGGTSLPEAGDLVHIPEDMNVVLDIDTPVLKVLLIEGNVTFENTNPAAEVTLNSEIILLTNGGKLEVGTSDNHFKGKKATIQLHGHVRSKELPIYGTKTIAVREGTLEFHGRPIANTWTKLDGTVNAGVDTITVMDDISDWQVGDEIVIASTGDRHSQRENEKRVIKAISGKTITLDSALSYKHMGEDFTYAGKTLQARAEVGLLTRNVVVRGSVNKEWLEKIEACEDGFNTGEFALQTCFQGRFGEELGTDEFGVHIMIHPSESNADKTVTHIQNTEITFAGQAFRMGRYPIHFHLNGDLTGSYVRKCAIHDTFNRAVNIHGTNYVDVEQNVVYNVKGGAFFLEDGVEIGNTFDGNLAVFVKQSTSLQNDDITPAAYWITNANNTVKNNHAVGGSHFGFWYRMHNKPDGPSYDPNYCPRKVPLGVFQDNTVHSQGWFGIWIFMAFSPVNCQSGGCCDIDEPKAAEFYRLTSWNNEKGAEWVNGGALQFKEFLSVNNEKAGVELKFNGELQVPYDESKGPLVSDCVIVAREAKLNVKANVSHTALVLPISTGFSAKRMTYVGYNTDLAAVYAVAQVTGSATENAGGHTYHLSSHTYESSTNIVRWAYLNQGVIIDDDGTVTGGAAGSKVLPTNGGLPPSCKTDTKYSLGVSGSICPSSVRFTKFGFHKMNPTTIGEKKFFFKNQYGTTEARWAERDLDYYFGWRVLLLVGEKYSVEVEGHPKFTNLSFDGIVSDLKAEDHITLTYSFGQEIDGIQISGVSNSESKNKTDAGLNAASDENLDWAVTPGSQAGYDVSILFSGKRANPKYTWGDRVDSSASILIYRCFYHPECKPPPDASQLPPPTEAPIDFLDWYNPDGWRRTDGSNMARAVKQADVTASDIPLGGLPKDGMDVFVGSATWVKINKESKLNLGTLILSGGYFEIEASAAVTISTTRKKRAISQPITITLSFETIIVSGGGMMFVGWENKRMENNVIIELRGSPMSPEAAFSVGVPIGAKAIGVFGGFEAHGQQVTHSWLRLKGTVQKGDTRLVLSGEPDWKIGDEIVVTATGFNPRESEKRLIVTKSGNTVTVEKGFQYKHSAGTYEVRSGVHVDMSAEVGLLTRNVKIVGADFDHNGQAGGMDLKGFGGRIVTGSSVDSEGKITQGFTRMSNVELKNMGQRGYTSKYDARFALTYTNLDTIDATSKPSRVSNCSFHNIYSSAIGVFGTNGLNVSDNVVYGAYGSALIVEGRQNRLVGNLVTGVTCPADRASSDWFAAIELQNTYNLVLEDNSVSGYDHSGYRIDGEKCGDIPKWRNNHAHSGLTGVLMLPDEGDGTSPCSLINNFISWHNYDYGFYLQTPYSVVMQNNVLIENRVGTLSIIYGEDLTTEKYALIRNGSFVGKTDYVDSSNCDEVFDMGNVLSLSGNGRSWWTDGKGMTGVSFTVFLIGNNKAPRMKFAEAMSHHSVKGYTMIKGTTFKNYGYNCMGSRDFAVSTPFFADDGLHPLYLDSVKMDNVDNKVYFSDPRLDKINPSDCVDMDCDGLKQTFVKDFSGDFFGTKGASAIPMTEKFWDGDKRRGLGDYRIPPLSGKNLDMNQLAGNGKRGILKDATCELHEKNNAWHCKDLDYSMLHLKSMDEDSQTRRLSPVAIQGDVKNAPGVICKDCYIELVNGPQDHGWCNGYTCQKRASLFPIILASGKTYHIVYTGVAPQDTRMYWLANNTNQAVVVGIYYERAARLDVYVDGMYVKPKNGDLQSGRLVLDNPMTETQYMPLTTDENGANYFARDQQHLYVLLKGGADHIDIKTSPQIMVNFGIPSMTEDEFFEMDLLMNLAAYFDIPQSKMKVAMAVRESRRKRQASVMVTLTISNPPRNLTDIDPSELSLEQMQNISQQLINAYQLNQLGAILKLDILSFEIVEPLPGSGTDQWKVFASLRMNSTLAAQVPSYMRVVQEPEVIHEGAAFKLQPSLQLYDASGESVKQAGSMMAPWKITGVLKHITTSWASQVQLVGMQTVTHNSSYFNFTDLAVSHSGRYKVEFTVTEPAEASHFKIASKEFVVKERALGAGIVSQPKNVTEKEPFEVVVELIDAVTKEKVKDITWKGHSWTTEVSIYLPETFKNGKLSGHSAPVTVSPQSGSAQFSGLSIDRKGRYFLGFHYVTKPAGYDFVGGANAHVDVHPEGYTVPEVEKSHMLKLRFDKDFSFVAGYEMYFSGALHNQLWTDYPELVFTDYKVTEGSILVEFRAGGSDQHLQKMLDDMWTRVQSGYKFTFNGTELQSDKILWVNGDVYGQGLDYELHMAVIIMIILISLTFVAVSIGLGIYKYHNHQLEVKKMNREPTVERRGLSFVGNTDDYFRVPEYKRTPSSLSSESVRNADDENLILSQAPKATAHFNFGKPKSFFKTPTMLSQEDYPGTPAPPYQSRPTSTTALHLELEQSTLSKPDN